MSTEIQLPARLVGAAERGFLAGDELLTGCALTDLSNLQIFRRACLLSGGRSSGLVRTASPAAASAVRVLVKSASRPPRAVQMAMAALLLIDQADKVRATCDAERWWRAYQLAG